MAEVTGTERPTGLLNHRRVRFGRRYPQATEASRTSDPSAPVDISNTGHNRAVSKKCELKTNLDLVMAAAKRHTPVRTIDVSGGDVWAKFDDVTPYNTAEETEEMFWRLEAKRLLASAEADEPLLFNGVKAPDKNSTGGFRGLSDIADQIHCNLHVVQYDNQINAIEHCDDMFIDHQFLRSQRIIEDRLSSSEPHKNPRNLDKDNSQVYHALVDYITSTIARLLVRSINSEFLHTNSIMVLSKLSAKLKVLSVHSVHNAEISLESGQHTMRKLDSAEMIRDTNVFNRPNTEDDWDAFQHNIRGKARRRKLEPEGDAARRRYHLENMMLRVFVFDIMMSILIGIRGTKSYFIRNATNDDMEDFNMSSLVYEAGFSSHPTLVTQDRHGEIAAASSPAALRVCFYAFQILLDATKAATQATVPPRGEECTLSRQGSIATFEWRWEDMDTGVNEKPKKHFTTDMDVAVAIMIPLMCTNASICSIIVQLWYLTIGMEEKPDLDVPEYTKFAACFSMTTGTTSDKSQIHALEGTLPLSESTLARETVIEPITPHLQKRWHVPGRQAVGQSIARQNTIFVEENRQAFRELDLRIQSEWVINDNSITIKCEKYVLRVAVVCFILVSGGIAVGATVGERIAGVDPFGIATFCWAVAAFILLVSKSLLVENWPWRDFLRRRCVCRSVSELASVTGVNPQFIIAFLLHNEDTLILEVRGPFNAAFVVQESSGFSIDVQPTLRTLLLGGIIMVMVATDTGPALVGLNARRSRHYVEIPHRHQIDENTEQLGCLEIDPSSLSGSAALKLKRVPMYWYRVFGVYDILDRRFR